MLSDAMRADGAATILQATFTAATNSLTSPFFTIMMAQRTCSRPVLRVGGDMIKSALIDRVCEQNPHLRRGEVEELIGALLDEITTALARGDRVEIRGFGAFSVRSRDARNGRNPRTGAPVSVKRKTSPHFKAGKKLRNRLNPDSF